MKNIYTAICVVMFVVILALAFVTTLRGTQASESERIGELKARMDLRSQEWQYEQELASRGRLAEERMKALHYQNNLDRQELQRLEGNLQ